MNWEKVSVSRKIIRPGDYLYCGTEISDGIEKILGNKLFLIKDVKETVLETVCNVNSKIERQFDIDKLDPDWWIGQLTDENKKALQMK